MKTFFLFLAISLGLHANSFATNSSSCMSTTQCDQYDWHGNLYTVSGVYTRTSLNSMGGSVIDTLHLTIYHSASSSTVVSACDAYTWSNGLTYTQPGNYTYTSPTVAGCDSVLTLKLTLTNGVYLSPKVFLYGAYDSTTGLMKDSLRAAVGLSNPNGALPLPYVAAPIIPSSPAFFLPSNGAVISPGVLSVSGPNAIVDWVYIEIRNANGYSTLATKHALVQRDGDVVEPDGVSALYFPNVCEGSYYICIKHRNHLGVMTATPVYLSATTQTVDFTSGTVWVHPSIINLPRKQVGSVFTLIAGNARHDKSIRYNGPNNDKEAILSSLAGSVPGGSASPSNVIAFGYRNEDVNMDGRIKYVNADNDRNYILNMILSMSTYQSPNESLHQHTP